MSAHFDGGAEIAGRRLREVEVTYVDDPTLDMGAEDSDDCPASPPPTYYLRVREEKRKGGALRGSMSQSGGEEEEGTGGGGRGEGNRDRSEKKKKKKDAWSWRYVNVEKKSLLVWDRRGGRLLKSIPLRDVESLSVIPDQAAPASILEVYFDSQGGRDGSGGGGNDDSDSAGGGAQTRSGGGSGNGVEKGVLVLQARSRQETLLWAKVLQENVELMTKRLVPLENLDEETNLSDVQQLAKLLTHQLSELQDTGNKQPEHNQQHRSRRASEQRGAGLRGHIESIPEGSATDVGGN